MIKWKIFEQFEFRAKLISTTLLAVDSGGAGGARAPPEFEGSEKGRSLISAYWSLAITTNTPGFKKLSTALVCTPEKLSWANAHLNLCKLLETELRLTQLL